MKASNILLALVGILLAIFVLFVPAMYSLFINSGDSVASSVPTLASLPILLKTFAWSVGVAIISTAIGWPVGIRIASFKKNIQMGVLVMLVMTLVIPAYAIFYVWWQVWPSGTSLHAYVVEHGLLSVATKLCLASALVGWSWPIPALISTMHARSDSSLSILGQLDGGTKIERCWQRIKHDKKLLLSAVVLVAACIASNTTCFDLAQVVSIGNELRSVVASGGSIFDVPLLSFACVFIAVVASLALITCKPRKNHTIALVPRSSIPFFAIWAVLSGLPLVIALAVTGEALGQFWKLYSGDIFLSVSVAVAVAFFSICIFVASSSMHLSLCSMIKSIASSLDFLWIIAAFLPASVVASSLATSWHSAGVEAVYRTPLIVVIAHLTKVGFIASLGGRWVASCQNTRTLCVVDGVSTPWVFVTALRNRLLIAGSVIVGVSFAVSLGEVAMTTQISPPSSQQPIAVALLNAMHYQRPQIVTSALFLIVLIAGLSGICIMFANRKLMLVFVLALLVSCNTQVQDPIAQASELGGVGRSDGRFTTPRAIASNDTLLVVIDKTGRLQRFNSDGTFLSSWDLQLSGTGFPTGVSIDSDGLIWIADTHQQRILVLDQEGNEVLSFGEYGTGDGQFLYPTDIAFGKDGIVFVSEYGGNDRINVFSREGKFQYSFGHFGSDDDGFLRPQSIAISPSTGNIFITDAGNHRIVERTPSGEVVKIIASAGREKGQLLYPYGIVFDSPTTFLVCEFGNNRLQRFTVDGDAMQILGGAGDEVGLFKTPWAVEIGPDGFIVADTGNNRLQRLPYMMVF